MSKNLLQKIFIRRNNTVSPDASKLERIVEYYANGEMSKEEFEEAKAQLTLGNMKVLFDKCCTVILSENTKRAQSQMRANGRTTGYAPLGYKNVIRSNGKHDVVPDSKTAIRIKRLFELYSTGMYTLDNIAISAVLTGLCGKISKKPLTKVAIKNILKNPFYCGYARHKDDIFKHRYKSLISAETYINCQNVLRHEIFE